MTGFEPRISGVGSDVSSNCATTTELFQFCLNKGKCHGAVVVAQLAKPLLPTPEVRGSNPNISKVFIE